MSNLFFKFEQPNCILWKRLLSYLPPSFWISSAFFLSTGLCCAVIFVRFYWIWKNWLQKLYVILVNDILVYTHHQKEIIVNKNTHGFSTKWPVFVEKLDKKLPSLHQMVHFHGQSNQRNERYLLLCHAERSEASLQ